MLLNGRITGISGIMSGVAFTNGLDTAWKTAFMGEPCSGRCSTPFAPVEQATPPPFCPVLGSLMGGTLLS